MTAKEGTLEKRTKRGKTFTGCWTCRSRKVKCDLKRPRCGRCDKSGLTCGGYDIKLRWSKPVGFDIYGNQQSSNGGGTTGLSTETSKDEPQYRRRNIAFVSYDDEYEYYEDMDEELMTLLNPPAEKISNDKTWIIKKFGVFRGIEDENVVSEKRRRTKRKWTDETKDDKKLANNENMPELEAGTTSDLMSNDDFVMRLPTANNHEWISNELRDDALLSAAALQGFPFTNFQLPSGASSLDDMTAYNLSGMSTNTVTRSSIENRGNEAKDDGAVLQKALQMLFHRNLPVEKIDNSVVRCTEADIIDSASVDTPPESKDTIVPHMNEIKISCSQLGSKMPITAMEVVHSPIPDPEVFNLTTSSNPLLNIPTTGLKVKGLTRFLLNYYYQNVADLMTVVALITNPWKTQYFPRALKAIGDLAGLGYTSNSRNSLLNALLAVSCFNLKSKFDKNSNEAQFFLAQGIEFRKQASNFLKLCLKHTVSKERYKDVLTAILSMNSIDVVWGTMADCQHHLAICEDFIENRMKERPKISQKAKDLHRIFSFLKLIQDSTALDKVREKEIVIRDTLDDAEKETNVQGSTDDKNRDMGSKDVNNEGQFRESLNKIDGKIHIEFIKTADVIANSSGSTPIFNSIASESYTTEQPKIYDGDILSTDALYGLPNSLILLFSDCVRLVRHSEYYNLNNMPLPRQFTKVSLKYEKRLLKWNCEWDFHKENKKEFVDDTIEGVYHHTMSFYNSLIIYYFTMAKSLDYQFLQAYVSKVLYHLKALNSLIQFKNVKIVPLIWQGFIAGCAAVNLEIQEEFKKWAASFATNGMGSYWGARQVMFEVWRRRLSEEQGDSWYSVYKDWEMNLMLS